MPSGEDLLVWVFPSGWVVAAIVLGVGGYFAVGILASTFDWKRFQPAAALLIFGVFTSVLCFFFTADWHTALAFFLWLTIAPRVGMLLMGAVGITASCFWRRLGGE